MGIVVSRAGAVAVATATLASAQGRIFAFLEKREPAFARSSIPG